MYISFSLPNPHSLSIAEDELRLGRLKTHIAFWKIIYAPFVKQVKEWIKNKNEAAVLTRQIAIRFWIASGRFETMRELYQYLDRVTFKSCQQFINYTSADDAPVKLIYREIHDPALADGLTDEELYLKIETIGGEALLKARWVFNLRYNRNMSYEQIEKVTGLDTAAVRQHDRHAMQLLYLLLTYAMH